MADYDYDSGEQDFSKIEVSALTEPRLGLRTLLEARLSPEDLELAEQFIEAIIDEFADTNSAADTAYSQRKGIAAMDVDIEPIVGRITRKVQALQEARDEVEPIVGTVIAADANATYCEALRRLGHDSGGLPGRAAQQVFRMAKRGGGRPSAMAMDAVASDNYLKRFPDSGRLKR